MVSVADYPLTPFEGVVGTPREHDPIISLEYRAMPWRAALIAMAHHLSLGFVAYGDQRGGRIRHPRVGDLVVEQTKGIRSLRGEMEYKAFGYLLGHRTEYTTTDAEWERYLEENPDALDNDDGRWTDDAWYIQYGPQPIDICRWVNCSFVAIPTDLYFFTPGGVK